MRTLFSLLLVALLTIGTTATAQQKMEWTSSDQLSWKNFKAKPRATSPYHALTNSGISFETTYENGVMNITVLCTFNPLESWVKPDKKSDELLKHEQVHFDITELYARKLRKALKEFKWERSTLERDLGKLFDRYLGMQDKAQHRYDEETDHSKNKEAQAAWNKRMAKELKELEDFSGSAIELTI